ncbi:hypothetical protein Trydic_g20065 [Trypoxylus dichotomus]
MRCYLVYLKDSTLSHYYSHMDDLFTTLSRPGLAFTDDLKLYSVVTGVVLFLCSTIWMWWLIGPKVKVISDNSRAGEGEKGRLRGIAEETCSRYCDKWKGTYYRTSSQDFSPRNTKETRNRRTQISLISDKEEGTFC